MAETARSRGLSGDRWLPVLLLGLSLWDLRTEFLLLWEHFTFTQLIFAVRHHCLAVIVLFCTPSLWRRYGVSRRRSDAGGNIKGPIE